MYPKIILLRKLCFSALSKYTDTDTHIHTLKRTHTDRHNEFVSYTRRFSKKNLKKFLWLQHKQTKQNKRKYKKNQQKQEKQK